MPTVPGADDATQFAELRQRLREIFKHALAACSVSSAMQRHVKVRDGTIRIGNEIYDIAGFSRINVVSIGKAGHSLATSLSEDMDRPLSGVVSCPSAPESPLPGFRYFIGGHPLPNAASLAAGDAILDLLRGSAAEALNIFLISGGASAIAEKPISPAISLQDVISTYKVLVRSGAPISEINAIRKHLSAIKGGRVAEAVAGSRQVSILVSDVPENALDALASGPTMPDTTTTAQCYSIAERYKMTPEFPFSVRELFEGRSLRETPKAGDPAFYNSRFVTILSNATAVNAVVECAAADGFAVEVDNSCDDWDYAAAADHLLSRLRELRRGASRVCLISGGEVTVKPGSNPGLGGRNQQFALYCAQKIAGEQITLLSAGTDGIDGNSQAAGAVADGSTVARAQEKGIDPAAALARFDAFPLFEALGDAIVTGPTGNNVRDIRVLLAC